jgi:hypothetical protein
MSSKWARNLANQLYGNWQKDTAKANLATERDRNQALGAVDLYGQQDFTLPQSTIDRDTATMLGETTRFRNATPTLNYGAAEANADKQANLRAAQGIADNGQAMQDRSSMTGLIQEYDAKEAAIPDRASGDRASMIRLLASYAKESAGIKTQEKEQILGQIKQQEDANNAAQMASIAQSYAQQGVTMSPWMTAQIGARLSLASQDRLNAKAVELEQLDRQLKNSADQFYLSSMNQMLGDTRNDELAAAQVRESLAASNDATALQLYDNLFQSTRQDQLAAQTTGAQLGQQARATAGAQIQNADQIREQLKLSRDTAGLQLLDSVLGDARSETRQNQQTRMTQQSTAAQMLNQILSNTEYQTMDAGQMASLISMLAKGGS